VTKAVSVVVESGWSSASGVYRVKVYRIKLLGELGPQIGVDLRGASQAAGAALAARAA
jgi:hypothetical protein